MSEFIKKALDCKGCSRWDRTKEKCKDSLEPTIPDDRGKKYCVSHKDYKTNIPTNGFKLVHSKNKTKVWFVSDLHFGHSSILIFHPWRLEAIGVTKEEFLSDKSKYTEIHDKWLIEKWNNTISKHDTVYILGDVSFGNKEYTEKILQQLHGKKYLIKGNHDKPVNGLENYFEWVGDLKEVKFTNNQFSFIDPSETFCCELCHYPLLTWNRRPHGSVMVHGHCHGSIDNANIVMQELRVDVGFDSNLNSQHGGFVDLETLYNYFISLRKQNFPEAKTFEEYTECLMNKIGYRA